MTANQSSAVKQQRRARGKGEMGPRGHRLALDYFPTPPWATRALCRFLIDELGEDLRPQSCWEPACGELHMARPLAEYFSWVEATDVQRYSPDHGICDFLMDMAPRTADWICTNPPFQLAEPFIRMAIKRARRGVAMLVRSAFTESEERYESLFAPGCARPSYVVTFSQRVVMLEGRLIEANRPDPFNLDANGRPVKATSATSYSWLIWQPGQHDTRHRWIGKVRDALTRPGDYPEYPEQWAAIAATNEGELI